MTSPLLMQTHIRRGTHITAIGSDSPHKQELDAQILAHADAVVADSIEQCRLRGEIHQAQKLGCIHADRLLELGNVIAGRSKGRQNDEEVTVADLTGVAVQDIQICNAVLTSPAG